MKRLFDLTIALISLIILAPALAIIATLVWLDDPGPIIYHGERIGRNGRPFRILKFRTMRRLPTLTSAITLRDDPRVTRIGRLLRATKLDETPQLLNILRGEMSLVGPRPESPHYVTDYTAEQRGVLTVRPGLTGAAQIQFRAEQQLLSGPHAEHYYRTVLMPTKLALDLAYIQHRTFWLDLRLIARTCLALIAPPRPSISPTTSTTPISPTPPSRKPRRTLRAWLRFHILRRLRSYTPTVALDILIVAAAFQLATALRALDTPTLQSALLRQAPLSLTIGLCYAAIAYLHGLHRRLWRYASLKDASNILRAVALTALLLLAADLPPATPLRHTSLSILVGGLLFALLFLGAAKLLPRLLLPHRRPASSPATPSPTAATHPPTPSTRVLIVGAGQAGADLASRLLLNHTSGYQVIAFLDDDPAKWNRRIHGMSVFGPISLLPQLVAERAIDLIAIALPSTSAARIAEIIALCQQTSAKINIAPGLHEIVGLQTQSPILREVNVADLLGRAVVPLQSLEAYATLRDSTILVTGAAGSIGSELCRQLLDYAPARIIALDNNETGLFDLAVSLHGRPNEDRLTVRIGDITRETHLARIFERERPDIIFHAAAYKHVPLLEQHPDQAILTNVLGTYTLCRLAQQHAVHALVFISSDKAAEPVSTLGASKRLGELIVQALAQSNDGPTRFRAVRFGNVIGSRGSVVPTFLRQIAEGGPVTVTDPTTTRYFMTIPEACGLVINTVAMAEEHGLFLLDMGEPLRIADLAKKLIRLRGLRVGDDIAITYTGLRPGERLHETLTAADEILQPTAHSKILHILNRDTTPTLTTLDRWMQELSAHLADDPTALRLRLLDLAHSKVHA